MYGLMVFCAMLIFYNLTMPAHLLWTLMFLKQCSTEEVSASWAGVNEDAFRDWPWCVLNAISNLEFSTATHNHATSVLTIFRLTLTTGTQIAMTTSHYQQLTGMVFGQMNHFHSITCGSRTSWTDWDCITRFLHGRKLGLLLGLTVLALRDSGLICACLEVIWTKC